MEKDLYNESLRKNHRWNTMVNILEGSFFAIAFVCFMPSIIAVSFLKHYTDNIFLLNLTVFICSFAASLGPFLMSFISGRFRSKKKVMIVFAALQRILWLPVVAVVLFSANLGRYLIPVFFVSLVLFYLNWGFSSIFWQEVMGRVFINGKIASSMGLRACISGIIGFFASLAVMYILNSVPFPGNFRILFIAAFVFMSFSWGCLILLREAPYHYTYNPRPVMHLRNMILLPAKDKEFGVFMLFIVFIYGTVFIGGLYTIIALERFGKLINSDSLTGIINAVIALSTALFAFLLGKIYEKAGKFSAFTIVSVFSFLLPTLVIFCDSYYLYLAIIFFIGIVNNLGLIELSTVIGFAQPEKRNEYLGFIALVKLIIIIVYANIGGLIAHSISPNATFATASVFCMIGLGILIFKLRHFWNTENSSRNIRI